jgi:hypothetical protein
MTLPLHDEEISTVFPTEMRVQFQIRVLALKSNGNYYHPKKRRRGICVREIVSLDQFTIHSEKQ